jgi:PAS domain S-box-containing protein
MGLVHRSDVPTGSAAAWLSAIVNSAEDAIIGETLDGEVVSWNPAAERLFGYRAEEILGQSITILADPARPEEMSSILERLRQGQAIGRYETTRRRKDGSLVAVSLTVSPVRDSEGRLIGTSKIARDITNRRRSEERIRLLNAELAHRTKNLLTIAAGIVRRSTARTLGEYRDAVEGRIVALDHANRLMIEADRPLTLDSLVLEVVQPFRARDEFVVAGPSVSIGPRAAVALALAIHELATNALKYGALCRDGGKVEIVWEQIPHEVRLRWRESGGPAGPMPAREGQGLRAIRSCIEGQLGGATHLHWPGSGLECEMQIPADQLSQ